MGNSRDCILGQTDSDFHDHMSELGLSIDKARELGFEVSAQAIANLLVPDEYEKMTAIWKRYLWPKKRKQR